MTEHLHAVVDELDFDASAKSNFNGTDCEAYYDYKNNYVLYATEDHTVLGYNGTTRGMEYIVYFFYNFDNIPMKTFAATESELVGCNASVYTKPSISTDICNSTDPSDSSSDSSSSSSDSYGSTAADSSSSSSSTDAESISSITKSNVIISFISMSFLLILSFW